MFTLQLIFFGLTRKGQVQDRYGTGMGQVWDRYGTVYLQEMDHELRRVGGSNQLPYTLCCYCLCV